MKNEANGQNGAEYYCSRSVLCCVCVDSWDSFAACMRLRISTYIYPISRFIKKLAYMYGLQGCVRVLVYLEAIEFNAMLRRICIEQSDLY